MAGVFDFAPNSHVAEEIPPEEQDAVSLNGWEFSAKPAVPYRARFRLTLSGMYWHAVNGVLDPNLDPQHNALRLREFYKAHRKWDTFLYGHEYLGPITCKFSDPVIIPKALPNSNGLIPDFEVILVHYNPGYD